MFGKKEISPAEMRELNEKSFKKTQAIFRRRLREIAAGGENKAKYKEDDYCAGEYIKGWLRSLGFTCKDVGWGGWVEITWPESLTEKEVTLLTKPVVGKTYCHPMSKPVQDGKPAWYLHHWTKCPTQWDYICSCCNEHSEYATKFCPNCGAKMHLEEGKNGT